MAFKRKKPGEPALPTDSISDIAFLLIIFFILTTTLNKLTGFSSEIPSGEASKETKQDDKKTPTVQLTNGKVLFNDQEVAVATLADRLKDLRLDQKEGEEKVVLLEAAGKVEYQTYYEVLAAVSAAGGIVAILEEGK